MADTFPAKINTLMNSDTTLNGLVSGIFYSILPDNSDVTGDIMLFAYMIEDSEDTFSDIDVLEYYSLFVKILSADTADIETIANALRDLLDDYSDANFRDVRFIRNSQTLDGEKGQYTKNYEYKIIFQNNT